MADKRLGKRRAREVEHSDEEDRAPEQQQHQQHATLTPAPAAETPSGSGPRRDEPAPPDTTNTEPDDGSSRPHGNQDSSSGTSKRKRDDGTDTSSSRPKKKVTFATKRKVLIADNHDREPELGSWSSKQISETSAFTDFEDIGIAQKNPTLADDISTLDLRIRNLAAAYNTTRNEAAERRPERSSTAITLSRPTPFTPAQEHEVGRIRQMINHINLMWRYRAPQSSQQQAATSDPDSAGSVESDEESEAEHPDSFEDDDL